MQSRELQRCALVTGANGFLGGEVVRTFLARGWRVFGTGRSAISHDPILSDDFTYTQMPLPDADFEQLVRRVMPHVCVHCAGMANPTLSVVDPLADFSSGPLLTAHLMEAFRRHSARTRIVFLSSAAVYGNPAELPIHEHAQLTPISPYGYHKVQSELIVKQYRDIYGMWTTSGRIFSAYGPGLRRQVVWDIVANCLQQKELVLHGTGKESRDFIFGGDVAEAVYCLATAEEPVKEVYNIGSGRETTIGELAQIALAKLARNIEVKFNQVNPHGVPLNWRADVTELSKLGFRCRVDLAAGIDQVLASMTSPAKL